MYKIWDSINFSQWEKILNNKKFFSSQNIKMFWTKNLKKVMKDNEIIGVYYENEDTNKSTSKHIVLINEDIEVEKIFKDIFVIVV